MRGARQHFLRGVVEVLDDGGRLVQPREVGLQVAEAAVVERHLGCFGAGRFWFGCRHVSGDAAVRSAHCSCHIYAVAGAAGVHMGVHAHAQRSVNCIRSVFSQRSTRFVLLANRGAGVRAAPRVAGRAPKNGQKHGLSK
eukprot:SAG22_NODE_9929_length_563_cov_0.687500_1_plen_138_part_10